MVLVFASNNAHKLSEVREIMPAGVEVLSLRDIGFTADIEETGATLEENSRIKAATVAAFINDRMSASLNDEMMEEEGTIYLNEVEEEWDLDKYKGIGWDN